MLLPMLIDFLMSHKNIIRKEFLPEIRVSMNHINLKLSCSRTILTETGLYGFKKG